MASDFDDPRYRRDRGASYHDDPEERPYRPRVAPGKLSRTGAVYGRLSRMPAASGPVDADPTRIDAAARTIRQPLPADLRAELEQSIGADLSEVRIHTSAESADAAQSIAAKAYATGNDIHFAPGTYDPSSEEGRRLIAHEVAHTVQQTTGSDSELQAKPVVSQPGDALEQEADRVADAFVRGESSPVQLSASEAISRSPEARSASSGDDPEPAQQAPGQRKPGRDLRITFKGLRPRAAPGITAAHLPSLASLLTYRDRMRALREATVDDAVRSVQGRPELRFMSQREMENATSLELPVSYIEAPPTPQLALFLAAHFAVLLADNWLEIKLQARDADINRIGSVGGIGTQGTAKELAYKRLQRAVQVTLNSLGASALAGLAVFAVDSWTDDQDEIAAAATGGQAAGVLATARGARMARAKVKGRDRELQQPAAIWPSPSAEHERAASAPGARGHSASSPRLRAPGG